MVIRCVVVVIREVEMIIVVGIITSAELVAAWMVDMSDITSPREASGAAAMTLESSGHQKIEKKTAGEEEK